MANGKQQLEEQMLNHMENEHGTNKATTWRNETNTKWKEHEGM